jgi:galactokinase/mevalonate kinase-like predicted kinase
MFVVFTGHQRLARNTLINALRKCSLVPFEDPFSEGSSSTVSKLIQGAHHGFSLIKKYKSAVNSFDIEAGHKLIDDLSVVLNEYWELKKEMAAGSEPNNIKTILDKIRPIATGLSLCGAGAGGFAVVILDQKSNLSQLKSIVNEINASQLNSKELLTVHSIQLDAKGIVTKVFDDQSFNDIADYLL